MKPMTPARAQFNAAACVAIGVLCVGGLCFGGVIGFRALIERGIKNRDIVNQMDWAPVEANRVQAERNVVLRRIAVALELEYMRKYGSFPAADDAKRNP